MKHRERIYEWCSIIAFVCLCAYFFYYIEMKKDEVISNHMSLKQKYIEDKRKDSLYRVQRRVDDSLNIEFQIMLLHLQSKASKYDSIMREQDESM